MANAPCSRPVSYLPDSVPAPEGFRVREFTMYAVVFALGAAMLTGHRTGAVATGTITLLAGICGCAWELTRWLRGHSKQRAGHALQIARAQARKELKTARTKRKIGQNAQCRRETQTLRRAAHEREQAQRIERSTRNEREGEKRDARLARFAAVGAEAARLQTLPEPAWILALTDIFALRGLRLQTNAAPAPPGEFYDMLFVRADDGSLCVAHVLPDNHAGVVADVEALEQWRQQVGAQQAYLVGRNGFSAQAVRLAPRLPLTLVEPSLLAQWNITKAD